MVFQERVYSVLVVSSEHGLAAPSLPFFPKLIITPSIPCPARRRPNGLFSRGRMIF